MSRTLITLGILIVAIGVLWPWLQKLNLFRLPGDIMLEKGHFRFYFPITSMLIISVVLTVVLWLLRR